MIPSKHKLRQSKVIDREEPSFTQFMSEKSLAHDWLSEEDEEAWKEL